MADLRAKQTGSSLVAAATRSSRLMCCRKVGQGRMGCFHQSASQTSTRGHDSATYLELWDTKGLDIQSHPDPPSHRVSQITAEAPLMVDLDLLDSNPAASVAVFAVDDQLLLQCRWSG